MVQTPPWWVAETLMIHVTVVLAAAEAATDEAVCGTPEGVP
jgi:hypothetical protein